MVYEKDPLFERDTGQINGRGYSFDLALEYRIDQNWDLALEVLDIYSKMKVDDAPFTTATANSDTKNFDEDGYVVFDPVVTGFEGNKSFSFEFNTQTHLTVAYRLANDDRVLLKHHHYENLEFEEVNYVQQFDGWQLGWNLVPELEAVGFTVQSRYLVFRLNADRLDYEEMKYLDLLIHLNLPLD